MALGTAACSGSKSDDTKPNAAGSSSSSGSSTVPGTTTSSSASSGPEEKLPDLTAAQVVTAFAGKGYRCSTDGFGHSQIPGSAIIRRADGTVAVVSFDRGWQIFKADGPASLVAVCLRPHD